MEISTEQKEPICIHTFSGIAFDLLNPKPEMILLEDIIHSLALINRFNGASIFPYSVAQHSLYVASLLPSEPCLQTVRMCSDCGQQKKLQN